MKDRVPTPGQEGRVKITPESGGAAYYAKLEMADNPTQAGDEPIKANLLPDDVAAALGLTGNPQVKDALSALTTLVNGKAKIVTGSYTGTGTYGSGNPNSLTSPFPPKLVIVSAPGGPSNGMYNIAILTPMSMDATYRNYNFAVLGDGSVYNDEIMFSRKSGNTISWYTSHANLQMNSSGVVFNYMILG